MLYYFILFVCDVIFLVIVYEHAYLCLRGFNFSSKRICKENYFWRLNVIHYIWSSKTFLAEHSDLSHSFMTTLPWFMFVLHCGSEKPKSRLTKHMTKSLKKRAIFLILCILPYVTLRCMYINWIRKLTNVINTSTAFYSYLISYIFI